MTQPHILSAYSAVKTANAKRVQPVRKPLAVQKDRTSQSSVVPIRNART